MYMHVYFVYVCICIQGVSPHWGVYTIIGAFCQETQARATSPNSCKPLQADKWPRLQRGATKCVFMTQTPELIQKSGHFFGLSILPSFCVLSRAIHSPFLGISRCQASDVLLSISGGSWHQSLCTMVLYKPILHVLEVWGETKIGRTLQLKKSLKNS